MLSEALLSERELKAALARWTLENSRTAFIPLGLEAEDYIEAFVMPEVRFVHTQSLSDENGDLLTLLKAVIHLTDLQSRRGRAVDFVFYKILRTFTATPDVVPDVVGYIVVPQSTNI